MQIKDLTKKLPWPILAGALLSVSAGLFLFYNDLGDGLTRFSFDFLSTLRQARSTEGVVILYLDEMTHKVMEQPLNQPWDRSLHARLIDRLRKGGAKAVVFDIVFSDPGPDPQADQLLEDALRNHGRVILGGETVGEVDQVGSTIIPPLERFQKASAGWGLINFPRDSGGVIRQHPPFKDASPGLVWTLAKLVGARGTRDLKQGNTARWLNYYGPPLTLAYKSYHQGYYEDGVPKDYFQDQIVFVGARMSTDVQGRKKDEFGTAFSWKSKSFAPGVEIHATAFLNLVYGDWLTRFPIWAELLTIIGVAGIAARGLVPVRSWHSMAMAAAGSILGALAIGIIAWALFRYPLFWFAWLIPVVQIAVALAWSVFYNSIRLYIEKQTQDLRMRRMELEQEKLALETANEKLKREASELQTKNLEVSLARHISPERVRQMMNSPSLLRPGVETREVSILFSDIESYSKLAEGVPPEDLARQLNSYYEIALECIHQTNGTVIKLIGDSIFAIWNAPETQADHRESACRAALLLAQKLDREGSSQPGMTLKTRVGIHTGSASVGNVGSMTRFDYTAIGGNINLASRLEGLNKLLGTQILSTREIQKSVEGTIVSRDVGLFRFKGVGQLVTVHELIGIPGKAAVASDWLSSFASALVKFKTGQFDAAERGFQETIELRQKAEQADRSPEFRTQDGPSAFYQVCINRFRLKGPPDDWIGEIILDEK